MKKYDIVLTPKGSKAIVLEIQNDENSIAWGSEVSIDFLEGNPFREHNAWWKKSDLKVIKVFKVNK